MSHPAPVLSLNGKWSFQPDWNSESAQNVPADVFQKTEWLPAQVPGVVHTDLMRAGKIPDPFMGDNENKVQWVAETDWRFRRSFVVDPELFSSSSIELCAEGLDTFCEIQINDISVGFSDNMFLLHRLEVRHALQRGENKIDIVFLSALRHADSLEQKYGRLNVALNSSRVYCRKAQYSFGWDWGPSLATCGIWRPIYLIAQRKIQLLNLVITSDLDAPFHEAAVTVSVDAAIENKKEVHWQVDLAGPAYSEVETRDSSKPRQIFRFKVHEPRLWWPSGLGKQEFYQLSLTAEVEGGEQLNISKRIGLRRIVLEREHSSGGESFRFRINGVPMFCRGANWIPADSFLPRVTESKYRNLLTAARDANMNMIRVWGGGIYEDHVFYDVCDELGLTVWQDFMFACGSYPEHKGFIETVGKETKQIVRNLRDHPCIVLWCGNNENEWLWYQETGRPANEMPGARIFDTIIPDVLKTEDPSRPYWQSSPFGGIDPNNETSGNQHKWNMWSGWESTTAVSNDRSRFVTEFGFQAPACVETWKENITGLELRPQSKVMEHHNKQIEGTERLYRYLAAQFEIPGDFDEFVYKSQVTQAESLKTCVEHWRCNKFLTSGVLFWQLNDCWPVTGWSVIDGALRPKAAYWYARRFFAPTILVHRVMGPYLEFNAVNDETVSHSFEFEVTAMDFHGSSHILCRKNVLVPALCRIRLIAFPLKALDITDPTKQYIRARLSGDDKVVAEDRYFLLPIKHLQLPGPNLNTGLESVGDGHWRLRIGSDSFVKALNIAPSGPEFQLSDNFFDLDAGEVRDIDIQAVDKKTHLSESDISIRWVG